MSVTTVLWINNAQTRTMTPTKEEQKKKWIKKLLTDYILLIANIGLMIYFYDKAPTITYVLFFTLFILCVTVASETEQYVIVTKEQAEEEAQ